MSIPAGRLRERVTLQDPPGVDDGAGGQTGGWTDVATVHAAIVALSGDEDVAAGIATTITRYRVTLRRRAVSVGQRLRWASTLGPQLLDVRALLPSTDRLTVDLLCQGIDG